MKRVLFNATLLIATILLPYFAINAAACSCAPTRTPYEAYKEAKAVFIGKVVGSNDMAFTEQGRNGSYTTHERRYRFSVIEPFKGANTPEVEVNAGTVESICFTGFTVDETYLVYAYGNSEADLSSGFCSRTNILASASDDVYHLRALLKGVPEPRFYGVVTKADADFSKSKPFTINPVEGIRVIVDGEGKRFETVTDKQGRFILKDIPDGRYKAHPDLPDKYISHWPGEEEFILGSQGEGYLLIHQGDSAYAHFNIGWNNRISGRLLDAEGKPLRRAKAALLVNRPNQSPFVVEEDSSDYKSDGKYEFYSLIPGKYVVSLSIRAPFRSNDKLMRFYYPSAVSLKQAGEILIGETDSFTDKDIKLPPGYLIREIQGTLVWPDGSPITNGWACLTDSEIAEDAGDKYDCTNVEGRFSLQGFVGAEYWLHTSIGTLRMESSFGRELHDKGIEELKAKPVKIIVGKTNEPLRIVIPLPVGVEMPKK